MIASQLIRDALLDCRALGAHETVSGQTITDALVKLNMLVKAWQSKGYQLWKRTEVTLFLNPSQTSYQLGPDDEDDQPDHWAASYDSTTLDGAHVAGDETLTVDSTIGMEPDDWIGIELTNGTRQWTYIVSVSPTLRIADGLTGAASDGGTVYTYTTRPERPLKIIRARRAPYNGHDLPIDIKSLDEYADQVNKTTNGTPIFVAYKPTLVNGTLYVWQPSTVRNVLNMSVGLPFADIVAADDLDFPDEWMMALS